MLAPALLAGLVVTELIGERATKLDLALMAGVATAGIARGVRAPALLAVGLGIVVTAGIRSISAL